MDSAELKQMLREVLREELHPQFEGLKREIGEEAQKELESKTRETRQGLKQDFADLERELGEIKLVVTETNRYLSEAYRAFEEMIQDLRETNKRRIMVERQTGFFSSVD